MEQTSRDYEKGQKSLVRFRMGVKPSANLGVSNYTAKGSPANREEEYRESFVVGRGTIPVSSEKGKVNWPRV